MRWWKGHKGIRFRLYTAFSAISLLVAVLVFLAGLFQLRMAEHAALLEVEHVAHAIAQSGIKDPLLHREALQLYFGKLTRFAARDVFIVDRDRRIVADVNHPEDVGKPYVADLAGEIGQTISDRVPRTFVETDPLLKTSLKQFVLPFHGGEGGRDDPVEGALILEYTQIHEELMRDAWTMVYAMVALGIVLVLVSVYLGYRTVSRIAWPLLELRRGVARLSTGDFQAKVAVRENDEIGELAKAFNTMSADLHASHEKLLEQQSELERRVEARTSELRQANLRLSEEIDEHRRAQEQLTFLAQNDSLTGLANRHMFHDRLTQALAAAQRTGESLGCLFVDLDRFKAVNDTFGHSVGDELLVQVSSRLLHCLRGSDVVGRLGGDEFAVISPGLHKAEDAARVAQKVVDALSLRFDLRTQQAYVTASVGIAVYPQDGAESDTLLKNADMAMYRAKQEGRNNFKFYTPQMNDQVARRLSLETALRGALEREEYLLHYQPKVDLASGMISGFEALLRWKHAEHGLVSPAQFIPILEDTGLIVPVGEWILRTVCAQILAWGAQGVVPRPVAINLSARQFQQQNFDDRVREIMAEYAVRHDLIAFEITESMLMHDPAEAARMVGKLKQTGVKLSVDDFGTGYSSLAYLRRFPLDELKIDQSFIREATSDASNTAIILAIISMAHNLKLKVVAEGVETVAQAKFLRARGCDEMQGYYFSKPLPAAECAGLLAEDRRLQLPAEDAAAELRVLIVDDHRTDLELIERALKPDGYKVLSATDPRAALQILMEHRVDIVIADHNMPGMSGVAFMSAVRNLYPAAVRIVMSGSGSADMISEAVNAAGVHKYLSKTWDGARLRAEIRQARSGGPPVPGAEVTPASTPLP